MFVNRFWCFFLVTFYVRVFVSLMTSFFVSFFHFTITWRFSCTLCIFTQGAGHFRESVSRAAFTVLLADWASVPSSAKDLLRSEGLGIMSTMARMD